MTWACNAAWALIVIAAFRFGWLSTSYAISALM